MSNIISVQRGAESREAIIFLVEGLFFLLALVVVLVVVLYVRFFAI
jgi:flagellar biogenesis protein FliO